MIRPTTRRTPRLESLESRELLSGPTAEQQYMLYLINQVRTNPPAAVNRILANLDGNVTATLSYYNINLQDVKNLISSMPAQPPLAWSDPLASAAQGHSQDMNNTGVQSHTGSDGSSPQTRMDQTGYTNRSSSGEDAYAYSTSVDEAMQAYLIDWGVSSGGHRNNIMQPNVPSDQTYRDVGIGIADSSRQGFGPQVNTVDFGAKQNEKSTLLGVVYHDPNGNHSYVPGQGQGGVSIDATNLANGQTTSTQSQDAGGYQMQLDPGNYQVTAHVGNQVIKSQNVNIGPVNVEVDYDLNDPWQGGSLPTAAPTPPPPPPPAPAPTPTPTPTPPPPPPAAPQPSNTLASFAPVRGWTSWTASSAD